MNICKTKVYKSTLQQHIMKSRLLMEDDLQSYVTYITLNRSVLECNINLFRGEKSIWPDQCSYAISCLDKTHIAWQSLCQIFDEASSSSLSTSLDASINKLTIMLHYADQQMSQLIALIAAFGAISRVATNQNKKRRQEIVRKAELFMQISDDLIQHIRDLLVEAQQKQFTPLFLDQETASMSGEDVEEEHQPVIDNIGGLPDKSQRIKHLVDIGKDYKGYNHYVKGDSNHEQVSEQSIVPSDKDPLEV